MGACGSIDGIFGDNPQFTIIHFNDVYDIQPNKKSKFGAANFQAFISQIKQKYPESLVLFSGDAFSPSLLSGIYKGRHMVKCLNKMYIDAACFGNHQFDLEPQQTTSLVKACNFPWLLGNIKFKDTDKTLGNGPPFFTKVINNNKVGIFGVGGEDWLGILESYDGKLEYDDSVKYAKKMCKILKEEQGCNFIIALTHLRSVEDKRLAQGCPEIDIILGGHDHIKMAELINGVPVVKSGNDFENLSVIKIYAKNENQDANFKSHRFDFEMKILDVPVSENPDKKLKLFVDFCWEEYIKDDKLIGYTDCNLEGRFQILRCKQTNLGNFWADMGKEYYGSDACIINSGCIRNDEQLESGKLTYFTLSNIINNPLLVLKVTGSIILQIIEESLNNFPDAQSGNFLLISGIRYKFSATTKPKVQQIKIGNKSLQMNRMYSVTMPQYLADGGDGYKILEKCLRTVDTVNSITMLTLIQKFFEVKNVVKQTGWQESKEGNKKSILPALFQNKQTFAGMFSLANRVAQRNKRLQTLKSDQHVEDGRVYVKIQPKVDGRICCLDGKSDAQEIMNEPLATILNFSDIYDIQSNQDGKFGVVNFQAFLVELKWRYPKLMKVFSGNAFSRSKLSHVFRGHHMVNCMNAFGIDIACPGINQFDYDPGQNLQLLKNCNFPWVMGNIKIRNNFLGQGEPYFIKEINGIKIGYVGLGADNWNNILDSYEGQLLYEDSADSAKKISQYLKKKGCKIVVALSQLSSQKNKKITQLTTDIDLILGSRGSLSSQIINQIPIIKSGDNFKSLSLIKIYYKGKQSGKKIKKGRTFDFEIEGLDVPIAQNDINNKLKEYVDECLKQYKLNDITIGYSEVPLEARIQCLQAQETNFTNLLVDSIKQYFGVDCALMSSGVIKCNEVIQTDEIKYSKISDISQQKISVRQLPGSVILSLLESYYLYMYQQGKGFILAISGIQHTLNSQGKPHVKQIVINNKPISLKKTYSVAFSQTLHNNNKQLSKVIEKYSYIIQPIDGIDLTSLIMKLFNVKYEKSNGQNGKQKHISEKQKRLSILRSGVVKKQNDKYYYKVSPSVEGRIKFQKKKGLIQGFSSSQSFQFDSSNLISNKKLVEKSAKEFEKENESKLLGKIYPIPNKNQQLGTNEVNKQNETNQQPKCQFQKRQSKDSLFGFEPIGTNKSCNSKKSISECLRPS